MENPFEIILKKLDAIENLLRNTPLPVIQANSITEIFNLDQAADYISLSKATIYKKTSQRNIPHFKRGKRLYFKRSELDSWLTGQKVSTNEEIEKMAQNYIIKKGKFRF